MRRAQNNSKAEYDVFKLDDMKDTSKILEGRTNLEVCVGCFHWALQIVLWTKTFALEKKEERSSTERGSSNSRL